MRWALGLMVLLLAAPPSCSLAATDNEGYEQHRVTEIVECFLAAGRNALGLPSLDSIPGGGQDEIRVWIFEGHGLTHHLVRIIKDGKAIRGELVELFMPYSKTASSEDAVIEGAMWCEPLGYYVGCQHRLSQVQLDWERMFHDVEHIASREETRGADSLESDQPMAIVERSGVHVSRTIWLPDAGPGRSQGDRVMKEIRIKVLEVVERTSPEYSDPG